MSYHDDESLLEQITQCRRDASKQQSDWRAEARQNYEFVSGNQWSDDDRAKLEERQRPCVTFNRIGPVIDSVVGYEVNNQRETKYLPRTAPDGQIAETLSLANKWVRDRTQAEHEENLAFRDMLITGMGWIETTIDPELDAKGRIIMERVPPLEMRWDTSARKANIEDANWLIREKWLELDEVRERFPEVGDEILLGLDDMGDQEWSGVHDSTENWKYENYGRSEWWDEKEGRVLVGQYQWREREKVVEVGDLQNGRVVTFTPERWNRIKDRVTAPAYERTKWKYYQCIVVGPIILEREAMPFDGFSFRAMTAKRDEEQHCWYGLVRSMVSPQMWSNVFFSTAMAALQSNSKGGLMVEESAVNNIRALEDKWSDPSGIVMVNDGALSSGAIQEKSFGGYPPSLDNLMAFSINAIKDVSGVNAELLGMVGTEQSGVLEMERKQSALTILQPFFASMKRYRVTQGTDLLHLMKLHLTPGQMMRITDHDGTVFWQDPGVAEFDVVVSDAVSSPNLKNEVWNSVAPILPTMISAGVPIPPDMLLFSPIPDRVAKQWVQYINEKTQAPDMSQIQEQMQQMQAEIGKLQEENVQLKDKREAKAMEIQARQQEAQLEAGIKEQQMALDAKAREMELAYKLKISDADRAAKLLEIESRYQTEMTRIREQAEVQRENSMRQVETQQLKSIIDLQVEREKRENENAQQALEGQETRIEQATEELESYRSDMKRQRDLVLNYLKRRGGDIGELARKLDT